jgi:hypothetical protein
MISRFAPVAPLAVHRAMNERGVLGTYHLLLAHQVLSSPETHEQFYRFEFPKSPKGWTKGVKGHRNGQPYIIMDNSLIELGQPLPIKDVLRAGQIVGAKVIVLPDVLGDRRRTLDLVADAIDELDAVRRTNDYARSVKVLGVAQGEKHNDIIACAREMVQVLGVDILSVPRHVTSKVGSRIETTRAIAKLGKPIHLLGFSENLFDDFWTLTTIPRVMGIDSALPIWLGLQGLLLPVEPPVVANYGRRPSHYEQETTITDQVVANIRRVERWANIAQGARTGR